MRILFVSTRDLGGGAALAAYRLAVALQKQGHEVRMLVQTKTSEDDFVVAYDSLISPQIFMKIIRKIKNKWYSWLTLSNSKKRTLESYEKNPYDIHLGNVYIYKNLKEVLKQEQYDVLHLHWVDAFVRPSDLLKIQKPIIWTLHDCTYFTGGCPHPFGCKGYINRCDLTTDCEMVGVKWMQCCIKQNVAQKQKLYGKREEIHFVAPSHWMAQKMRESALLRDMKISVIPNCIDTNLFTKMEKPIAKQELGLSMHKRYIAYGAMNALVDKNKGYDLLQKAISGIDIPDIELLIFGATGDQSLDFGLPVTYMGNVDNRNMPFLYNAVDVMLVPSRFENLPNVILEAMACGTPVTAFAQGGCVELINHKQDGYLAQPYDTDDYRTGILWCLVNSRKCSQKAIEKVNQNNSMSIIAQRYMHVYKKEIDGIY